MKSAKGTWILAGIGAVVLALIAGALSSDAILVENKSAHPVEVCIPFQRCVTAAQGETVAKTIFVIGRSMRLRVGVGAAVRDVECEVPAGSSVLGVQVRGDGTVFCRGG